MQPSDRRQLLVINLMTETTALSQHLLTISISPQNCAVAKNSPPDHVFKALGQKVSVSKNVLKKDKERNKTNI